MEKIKKLLEMVEALEESLDVGQDYIEEFGYGDWLNFIDQVNDNGFNLSDAEMQAIARFMVAEEN